MTVHSEHPSKEKRISILVDSCVFIDSFDPASPNHRDSLQLLTALAEKRAVVTMPAHGWFEVQCALQRLEKEGRFVGPKIDDKRQYELKLIHIDDKFISRYRMADLPYIKAGDHIFLAVATPRVAWLQPLRSVLCGVTVADRRRWATRAVATPRVAL